MSTPNYSDSQVGKQFRAKFADRVLFNEPLSPYVAYRVGGPSDILVFPKTEEELSWLAEKAKEHRIPITVLGGGSNVLICDDGIRGITILVTKGFHEITITKRTSQKSMGKIRGRHSKRRTARLGHRT